MLFIVMSFLSVERFLFERPKSNDLNIPANDSFPSPDTRRTLTRARNYLMVTLKSPFMIGGVLSMDGDGNENSTKKLNSDDSFAPAAVVVSAADPSCTKLIRLVMTKCEVSFNVNLKASKPL